MNRCRIPYIYIELKAKSDILYDPSFRLRGTVFIINWNSGISIIPVIIKG